jgi:hypothetical protein
VVTELVEDGKALIKRVKEYLGEDPLNSLQQFLDEVYAVVLIRIAGGFMAVWILVG